MTVLQRKDARGVNTSGAKKLMVGFAMAVAGIGAAYGISQAIDGGSGAIVTSPNELARAVALAELAQASANSTWTLEHELAAIKAGTGVRAGEWSLEDELAALQRHNGTSQPESSSQPTTPVSGPR